MSQRGQKRKIGKGRNYFDPSSQPAPDDLSPDFEASDASSEDMSEVEEIAPTASDVPLMEFRLHRVAQGDEATVVKVGRPSKKKKRKTGGRSSVSDLHSVDYRAVHPPKLKKCMTIQERMNSIMQSRKGTKGVQEKPSAKGWDLVDFKKSTFTYPSAGLEGEFTTLYSTLPSETSLLQIFLRQLSPRLLKLILYNRKSQSPESWTRVSGPRRIGLREIYQTLACEIRITGYQQKPVESEKVKDKKALRQAFCDAQEEIFEDLNLTWRDRIGVQKMEFIHANFYLCPYTQSVEEGAPSESDLLSVGMLSLVSKIGQHLAGDEKVFHLTGRSQNVRLVESKKEVGLWIYELTTRLVSGLPLLLDCLLHSSSKRCGESTPVDSVVKRWCKVVKEKGSSSTILAFDSYYFSNASRLCVMEEGVRTIASVSGSSRFREVHDFVKAGVEQSGDFAGAYNKDTSELYLYHLHPITSIGKKSIWTNTLTIRAHERGASKYHIPGYDLYNCIFAVCDNFNRALHDRTFPHRSGGGRNGHGEMGKYWDFIRSSVIQNTVNIYITARGIDVQSISYRDICKTLSNDLFLYAVSQ